MCVLPSPVMVTGSSCLGCLWMERSSSRTFFFESIYIPECKPEAKTGRRLVAEHSGSDGDQGSSAASSTSDFEVVNRVQRSTDAAVNAACES